MGVVTSQGKPFGVDVDMLTQTTEIAIKALIYLAIRGEGRLSTPVEIARAMNTSASYLAKIMGHLVKTGLLKSHRGPLGGMCLARAAAEISLLDIVEATQGLLVANYCEALGEDSDAQVCGFHRAMKDVRQSTIEALRRWTLADVALPATGSLTQHCQCHLSFLYHPVSSNQSMVGGDHGGMPI